MRSRWIRAGSGRRCGSLARVVAVITATLVVGLVAGPGQAAAAPGDPTITPAGPVKVGDVLTEQDGTPGVYTYQWNQCDSMGANCTAATGNGATSGTYTVAPADAGHTLEVQATPVVPLVGQQGTSAPTPVVTGPPVNTTLPTISGGTPPQWNQTLTAVQGAWTSDGSKINYTYQWFDCDPSGANCRPAPGATGSTYLLGNADIGSTIEVQVTATNDAGAVTATSSPTAPVTDPRPIDQIPPTIFGATSVGSTLTDVHGYWNHNPTGYTYQWLRCRTSCAAIPGATGQTYALTGADVGATIEVAETASNAAGPAGNAAISNPTGPITVAPPTNRAAPAITGTPSDGQTLTDHPGQWTNNPSIATQWYLCDSNDQNCGAINGATGTTLQLTTADVGGEIQVVETASNGGGTATAGSGFVGPVTNAAGVVPAPRAIAGPGISGGAQAGQTLTATHAPWSGNPTLSDQWIRCQGFSCSAIPGATGLAYRLTTDDVGDTVAFQETAANAGGSGGSLTSSHTPVVTAPSSTSLTTTPGASVAGQFVTAIADVVSSDGALPPSGSVSFASNGAPIAGCGSLPVQASGQSTTVTCRTSFPARPAALTAAFAPAGGSLLTGSASAVVTVGVSRAPSLTSVTAPSHVNLGGATKFTARISTPAGHGLRPGGRIAFIDGRKPIKGCATRAVRASAATCSVTYSRPGTHHIVARYLGDPNFVSSVSARRSVRVGARTPSGYVSSLMSWTFAFTPSYTRVSALSITGLSAGIRISLSCRGGGCPFRHRDTRIVRRCTRARAHGKRRCAAPQSVSLEPGFRRRHLRVGAQLVVSVSHRDWLGKYYRFTMRSGRRPRIVEACLAVDSARPGVGCTSH